MLRVEAQKSPAA